jgi:hypothetical protein
MNNRNRLTALFIICFLSALIVSATAAVPQLISYQGRLTNSVGAPLDTTVALVFQIYADSNGVTSLWDETHPSVVIIDGLFQVLLGSVTPIGQDVFTGEKRWVGVRLSGGPATTLIPIVSAAYAYRSNVTDTAALAKTVSDNSITTAKIQNGTISLADINQNSATTNEVIKWNGSAWEAQPDATSANSSGWTDGGTVVNLTTAADTVALNTSLRLGKLNVGGNMSLTAQSSIYFGTDSTFIKGFTGGDMTLQGEDIFAKTTGSIYFADVLAGNWIEFDNVNKLVGVGTTAPDEKLQVENDAASGRSFLQLETSHATNFGETGIRFKTPQNTWHLRMDDYTNNNLADGALGLRSQVGVEAMTWLENGSVGIGRTNPLRTLHVDGSALIEDSLGIGTTNPTKKLHVYGSALIKDTLYAGAINPTLMSAAHLPDEPGVASVLQGFGVSFTVTDSWATIISRQITVPGPGYVFAIASAHASIDHTYLDAGDMVAGIAESPGGPSTSRWTSCGVGDRVGTGEFYLPLTCHTIYDVGSAGTYEYYFMAVKSIVVDDLIKVYGAQLSLIYVPTSYGTVSTKDTSGATAQNAIEVENHRAPEESSAPTAAALAERLQKLQDEIDNLKKELESKQ